MVGSVPGGGALFSAKEALPTMNPIRLLVALVLAASLVAGVSCQGDRDFTDEPSLDAGGQGGSGRGGSGLCEGTCSVLGDACEEDTQCASGICADGVCCGKACAGCMACAEDLTGKPDGTCAAAVRETDPHDACDVSCDGQGACIAVDGAPCDVAADCRSGQCTPEGTCAICEEAGGGLESCWVWPYPVGYDLNDVVALGVDEFVAVGEAGTVLRYLASDEKPSWTFERLEGAGDLTSVCTSGTRLYASSASRVYEHAGEGWKNITGTLTGTTNGLLCTADAVFRYGTAGLYQRKGAGAWSRVLADALVGSLIDGWQSSSGTLALIEPPSSLHEISADLSDLTTSTVPLPLGAEGGALARVGGRGQDVFVWVDYYSPGSHGSQLMARDQGTWTGVLDRSNSQNSPCSEYGGDVYGLPGSSEVLTTAENGCYSLYSEIWSRQGDEPAFELSKANLPHYIHARALSGAKQGDRQVIFAVGSNGQATRYEGNKWMPLARSSPPRERGRISAVTETAAGVAFGVEGYVGPGYREIYVGHTEVERWSGEADGDALPALPPGGREDGVVELWMEGDVLWRLVGVQGDSGEPLLRAESFDSLSEVWSTEATLAAATKPLTNFAQKGHVYGVAGSPAFSYDFVPGQASFATRAAEDADSFLVVGGSRQESGRVFAGGEAGAIWEYSAEVWSSGTIIPGSLGTIGSFASSGSAHFAAAGGTILKRSVTGWNTFAASVGVNASALAVLGEGDQIRLVAAQDTAVRSIPISNEAAEDSQDLKLPPGTRVLRLDSALTGAVFVSGEDFRLLRVQTTRP